MKLAALLTFVSVALSVSGQEKSDDPFASVTGKPPIVVEPLKIRSDSSGHPYFETGKESYYTEYLAAMKEPSLFKRDKDRPPFEFRFLWLRSFHDPISVRIWESPDGHMMRVIRVTQHKDYSLGPLKVDQTRKLSRDEWSAAQALLDLSLLLPPMSKVEDLNDAGGMDGARWIFETCANQKYQMLDFWSLKDLGPKRYEGMGLDTSKVRDTAKLYKLGRHLLSLAGLKTPENEIY